MLLVTIGSQGGIAPLYVVLECLQCHSLGQTIHSLGNVWCGPVNRLLKAFYRLSRQLDLAMPCLAVLQLLDVLLFQREALQVRKLRRIAETLDGEIARQLAQRVDVRGKLEVALWSRLNVHRAENEHFVRGT